ncbi:STAS-like domain-containing protein [Aggregatibacter kilianii]|uniref:STAS-like domain-containing protein n=1 Tax=Aggregatibacter kilianii TaxID=2025884 RepID=UPI000D65E705|nr:STAS-like domain-containing protein [Aggregatibacter kilianii]RDE87454.1 DUF4325 domain-containing protein [Aggregatibacter aphrophilus]
MTIVYVKEFSTTPGARYRHLGKASGEEFRDDILVPAFERDKDLIVDLDGVRGYGSSFLDEAFAGLVRLGKFTSDEIKTMIANIRTTNSDWKSEVESYVDDEIKKQIGN